MARLGGNCSSRIASGPARPTNTGSTPRRTTARRSRRAACRRSPSKRWPPARRIRCASIAGGFEDVVDGTTQVWGSVDGAQTWQKLASFPSRPPVFDFGGPCCSAVYAIAVDPLDPAYVSSASRCPTPDAQRPMAARPGSARTAGLGAGAVHSIAFDPANPPTIYAASTESGVFAASTAADVDRAGRRACATTPSGRSSSIRGSRGRLYAATEDRAVPGRHGDGAPAGHRRAIEFHHAPFDHYFVSADADEIEGSTPACSRDGNATSEGFAWPSPMAPANLPTCRFFGVGFAPLSSHFYTPYPANARA